MNPASVTSASRPLIGDLKSCEVWLGHAALADPGRACASFTELLDGLDDAPPKSGVLLQILERLRAPMHEALEEQTRRFAARPLPLAIVEQVAFGHALDLRLALLRAWQRLHRAGEGNAPELIHCRALLALREIECAAGLVATYFEARRDVAPGLWRWLHQAYSWAERHHLAETELAERSREATSCAVRYAEVLLVHLAQPWELSQRELAAARRWAHRWALKVKLWRSAENGGGLAVNFEGDAPPQWTPAGVPGASIRFVELGEVTRSIRWRLKKLGEGTPPAELGLGECSPAFATELLTRLSVRWSDARPERQAPRSDCAASAEVCIGFGTAYEAIAGRPFEPGDPALAYSRRAAEQIEVFQRVVDFPGGFPRSSCEAWSVLDESPQGCQLARAAAGMRISKGQLVALKTPGATGFRLAFVQWLRQGDHGSVAMGVRKLAGVARACVLRPQGASWCPALVLERPGTRVLVAPAGLVRNAQRAELRLDNAACAFEARFGEPHGSDFDLIEAA